jgi:hypothetical protein
MAIKYFPDLIQGSDEWLQARCGLLTASEMKRIITPKTLKPAADDKASCHLYELLAQRITRYVEPSYISDDMLRGQEDEAYAKLAYNATYGPVEEMGFITNDKWGFTLGFSPDGLVHDTGFIEVKSRCQKHQVATIISGEMPADFLLQIQTGFLVSERAWCDFISFPGVCQPKGMGGQAEGDGLPMMVRRAYPDDVVMAAIIDAAGAFEAKLAAKLAEYRAALAREGARLIQTERRKIDQEIAA